MTTQTDAQADELIDDETDGDTAGEKEARRATTYTLDEVTQETVDFIIERMLVVIDEMSGHPLYEYQTPFARRFLESLIIGDGATITALWARQSGKSETISNTIAAVMVMFPVLAKVYPRLLGKFREGVWVGAFGPVDEQADNLYGRIVSRLTSDRAVELMADPDIQDGVKAKGRTLTLTSGSLVRKQTAHPKATIEGRTYHVILIDECFPADTPVLTNEGWVKIQDIARNPDKRWIVATQGANGAIEWAPVKSSYKTRRQNDLVRVVHEHGTLYATANHPFVVGSETIPAATLRPGTCLSLVQRTAESSGCISEEVPQGSCGGLRELSQGAVAKSVIRPGEPSTDIQDAQGNGASPFSPWGEWDGSDQGSTEPSRLTRAGMEPRACRVHWRKGEGRAADALQDRPGESVVDDRRRGGRWLTRDDSPAASRSSEVCVVIESRVVSVAILEPGSPEFDRFSDRADYVYTLEVDHPSHTYVAAGVLVGNCQGASEIVVNKSISPMATATLGTKVFTGTPTYTKGVFYDQIQTNKREGLKKGKRQNHFEADWKAAGKANPNYYGSIQNEILRIGEDSDEFKLSYRLLWLLEAGMFTSSQRLNELGDVSMETVKSWSRTPVVVGIDPARKQDSTIVTVVYVDWDNPDEFGFYNHRILNWLDLGGTKNWETQYHRIVEFLNRYQVLRIGVDSAGVGDAVADRLKVLMPYADIVDLGSDRAAQSKRWKHLYQLLDRGKITWPSGARARELKTYKRFIQEMEDLQLEYAGPYMLAAAPEKSGAHDDYSDSLAMACILTTEDHEMATVEVSKNFFYGR